MSQRNLLTKDFDFDLPQDRIAAEPVTPRDHARLLHVRTDGLSDHHIYDLPSLLREGDLLVVNDTKVIPARLYGLRGEGRVEIFLHKKLSDVIPAEAGTPFGNTQSWLAFAKPFKRLREGDEIVFADDFKCRIKEKRQAGEILVVFDCDINQLIQNLNRYGEIPLPPYIKRPQGPCKSDKANYQTIYAQKEGAVAAPTAGLHFTPELLHKLDAKGIKRVNLTLHVGAGTFLPVKVERLKDHKMHAEWGEITAKCAQIINETRAKGHRIIAVGTTSLRLLESVAAENGILKPFTGETSIFLAPGYRFKITDALLTNFHLPKSTLFMLVSAFSGLEQMKAAYQHAILGGYRFYSYGDATLLEKGAMTPLSFDIVAETS